MKNTLTNIIRRWDDLLALKKGRMILPQFVDLHTSNRCNQHCKGCAYAGMLRGQIMDEDLHFKAIDAFLHIGVKAFDFAGGGEPALIPYLPSLMNHIHERGGNFALITNGTVMTDDLVEALVRGATYCRFSLEAADAFEYREYKNSGAWLKVYNNIKKLMEARGPKKQGNLEISLKFSVGKSLQGSVHFRNALEYGKAVGADRINFAALTHEPEELDSVQRGIQENILRQEIGGDEALRAKVHYWIAAIRESDVPQCWLTPTHSVMDWEGNLYLCCYYYYRKKQMYLGNIFEDGFAKIWFSDSHWHKIRNIKREDCMKVRCKFFKHHEAIEKAMERGHGYFL